MWWSDEGRTCWGCLLGGVCESPERCGTPIVHRCPEPYPYDHARAMALMLRSSGMPVSQRVKARIVLGLRNPPPGRAIEPL